jgi:hypothetical protein
MTGSARIRNTVFSLATVLTLGFGAAQAFAAPSAPQKGAAMACNISTCMWLCQRSGYSAGFCEEFNGSSYCECFGMGPIIQPSGK